MAATLYVYSVMVAYKDPDDNVSPEHTGRLYATAAAAQKDADSLIAEAPDWFNTFRTYDEIDYPYAFVKPLEVLE